MNITEPRCQGCELRDQGMYELMQRFDNILGREIEEQRKYHESRWAGASHDDQHYHGDWCIYIDKQLNKAVQAGKLCQLASLEEFSWAVVEFEHCMVKIAALAVAAIQSSRVAA